MYTTEKGRYPHVLYGVGRSPLCVVDRVEVETPLMPRRGGGYPRVIERVEEYTAIFVYYGLAEVRPQRFVNEKGEYPYVCY